MTADFSDQQIIKAWIAFCAHPRGSAGRDKYFWAYEFLYDSVRDNPERAWNLIVGIIKQNASDIILANIAAGPVEDILCFHGQQFMDRTEALAQQDQVFRKLLGAVWQNAMSDDIWRRIKAVADPSW